MCVDIYTMCVVPVCICICGMCTVCLCLAMACVRVCICGVYMTRHTLNMVLSSRLPWHVGQYHMLETCSDR